MIKIIKSLLLLLFITSFALQANSETSWITKKSDKTKKEIRPVLYASYGQGGLEEPGYFMHQSMAGKYNLDEKEKA